MTSSKTEFEAVIIQNFKTNWIASTMSHENASLEQVVEWYGGSGLDELHNRISGAKVTIVQCEYDKGETDYFEKEDNNFMIHRNLFAKV